MMMGTLIPVLSLSIHLLVALAGVQAAEEVHGNTLGNLSIYIPDRKMVVQWNRILTLILSTLCSEKKPCGKWVDECWGQIRCCVGKGVAVSGVAHWMTGPKHQKN